MLYWIVYLEEDALIRIISLNFCDKESESKWETSTEAFNKFNKLQKASYWKHFLLHNTFFYTYITQKCYQNK